MLLFFSTLSIAQPDNSIQIQELMETLVGESEDETEATAIFEHLESVIQNPMEINSVDREQLLDLYIITDFQVYTFLEYREKYGRILSMKELKLIPGFNSELIEKLNYFLYAGDQKILPEKKPIKKYSDFKIINRYTKTTPGKNGFLEECDSLGKFFGKNYSRLVKLQYKLGDSFSAGLTMESDAGEAFSFRDKSYGYDFYSYYFQFLKPEKFVRRIILGDFRLSSGLGLVHGYGFGSKSSDAIIKKKFTEIKPYTSAAESGFYRGIGIKSEFQNIESIVYFSGNRQTAAVEINEEGVQFSSVDASGLHRNLNEKMHKNSIRELNCGLILTMEANSSNFSYNSEITQFEESFEYRLYPNRDSQLKKDKLFINQSVSYNKLFPKFNISGEWAIDKNKNIAGQHIIQAHIHPLLNMSMSYRFFSPKYIALHSNSFSESSNTRNEKGFYLGVESFPFRTIILNAYIDLYSFPWMRYDDTSPYSGTDFTINGKWLLKKNFYIKMLIKKEYFSEKVITETHIAEMKEAVSSRFSIQTNYDFSENMIFRNKIEIKNYQHNQYKANGYLIYQEVNSKIPTKNLSVNFRYTIFEIPDWSVRIYSWEHDLLYSFYTPVFYKTGQNILINIRFGYKKFKLGAKGSFTIYSNEYSSGSGIENRSGRNFSTWKIQWIYSI